MGDATIRTISSARTARHTTGTKPRGEHFGDHLVEAGNPPVKADPKATVADLKKVVKEGQARPSTVERLLADNGGSKTLKPYEKIMLQGLKEARDLLLPEAERVMRQLVS